MRLDEASVSQFQSVLWKYYNRNGRHDLPWRQSEPNGSFDPYKIMVSELMLQQTQVPRVIPKYEEFLHKFPNLKTLASAELKDILLVWSGLGYNRRAKYLHDAAKELSKTEKFPDTIDELVKLSGIGRNTAGAIVVYAFNKPAIFVETNIRTVYIHHFFTDQKGIADSEIVHVLTRTLPEGKEQPEQRIDSVLGAMRKTVGLSHREFYWALMDYGSYLKQQPGNLSKRSKAYNKQSAFIGSQRQIRGQVLKLLAAGDLSQILLEKRIHDERLQRVLIDLKQEGLIQKTGTHYHL